MLITPLGHTEFLVDMASREGGNARILIDSWLSDYALGDMMERTVKVRLDPEKIETIDAIYISHCHSDHFDPYTLYDLLGKGGGIRGTNDGGLGNGKGAKNQSSVSTSSSQLLSQGAPKPLLILPFTLRYLEPLLWEFLPNARVKWLMNKEVFLFK